MGAEAIAQLIERLDLDEEELKLREAIDRPTAPPALCPAQAEGDQAPEDRLGLQRRDENGRRVNDPRAMILGAVRSSRRPATDGAARRRPFCHKRPERPLRA